MFIEAHVCKSMRNSILDSPNVKDFMKATEEQFVTANKSLANTVMKNFWAKILIHPKIYASIY